MALDWTSTTQQDVFPRSDKPDLFAPELRMAAGPVHNSYNQLRPDHAFGLVRLNAAFGPTTSSFPWTEMGCTCGISQFICCEHGRATQNATDVDFQGESTSDAPYTQSTHAIASAGHGNNMTSINPVQISNSSLNQEQGGNAKKSSRTVISKVAKRILDAHFAIEPYPACNAIDSLAISTNLTRKNVQMWFANTRSRRGNAKGRKGTTSNPSVDLNSTQSTSTLPSTPLNASVLSDASLAMLNRLSSSRSPSPLETPMSTPAEEIPVSVAVLEATVQLAPSTESAPTTCFQAQPTPRTVHSIAASDNVSLDSAQSTPQCSNIRSVDHRGSRRGRKIILQHHAINRTSLQTVYNGSGVNSPAVLTEASEMHLAQGLESVKDAFYCTWPSCNKRFRNRSNWARHEEAVHYCPFKWICCHKDEWPCLVCGEDQHGTLHHFAKCATQDLEARTFFREDHLTRHINDAHLDPEIPDFKVCKQLLRSWKNIDLSPFDQSLCCGFCGIMSETWKQRQDHVCDHLETWICKSAWWPQRLAEPFTTYHISSHASTFQCAPCGSEFQDVFQAVTTHSQCRTWSCRYLHNEQAIMLPNSSCRLCPLLDPPPWSQSAGQPVESDLGQPFPAVHGNDINFHRFRDCDQALYTSAAAFIDHLRKDHNAWFPRTQPDLTPWQRVQVLEVPPVAGTVHPSQYLTRHNCCAASAHTYTLATVLFDD